MPRDVPLGRRFQRGLFVPRTYPTVLSHSPTGRCHVACIRCGCPWQLAWAVLIFTRSNSGSSANSRRSQASFEKLVHRRTWQVSVAILSPQPLGCVNDERPVQLHLIHWPSIHSNEAIDRPVKWVPQREAAKRTSRVLNNIAVVALPAACGIGRLR